MGKKGLVILLLVFSLAGKVFAQADTSKGFVHAGMLRAAASFAVGRMPAISVSNAYLTGNIEYYADSKISVRGDGYYFFNSLNNSNVIKQNHQLYFGACYNFPTNSHLNPFIGLQPGVALMQLSGNYSPDNVSFSPIGSVVTGLNFYADNWFHIMINLRYSFSRHLDEVSLFNSSEFSFCFGLGWNLDVLKKNHITVHKRTVE